jgi:hypothetical protein
MFHRRLGDSPQDPTYPGRAPAPPGVNLARPTFWDDLQAPTFGVPTWLLLAGFGLVVWLTRR